MSRFASERRPSRGFTTALASVLAAVALAGAACDRPTAAARERPLVRLTTGHPGAFFNPLGAALADALSQAMPDVDFQVVPSGGALENLEFLQRGTADLGLTFADIAYLAYSGRLDEQQSAFERLRGVAVLQLTAVHVLVRKGSDIHSIAQLGGRRVALGPRGSGTAVTAQVLLAAYQVPLSDLKSDYLPFLEAANRLARGELDAIFVSAGYPVESVASATDAGATLLDVSGPDVERLRNDYPFLRATIIPAGTYPSIHRPVHTVGIDAAIVCASTLDEDLVYRLTGSFFEALPTLAREVDALRRMDIGRAPATPVPLHSGAARFYRERELFR
jgi:TRAP transporter TAXI family solute receptor